MGTGVMIGAGIFALTGQVAEQAGGAFPLAFLCAALAVAFSGHSCLKVSNACSCIAAEGACSRQSPAEQKDVLAYLTASQRVYNRKMNWRGTKQQRLWYGLTATVGIGPGFWHQAGFGRLLIPHPPVVNWLLRKGVRQAEARSLAFLHEIAHFQTGPLALLWLAANTAVANAAGNLNLLIVAFLLVSSHAAWEILAETYVRVTHRSFYRQCYRGVPKLPRFVFFAAATAVSLAGCVIAVH